MKRTDEGFAPKASTFPDAWRTSPMRNWGVTVRCGRIEEADIEEGSIDAVIFWDVLEHVHNPLEILAEIQRITRPGGHLFGQVPNWRGLTNRYKTFLNRHGLARKQFKHFGIPHHIFNFDESSLRRMMEKSRVATGLLPFVVKIEVQDQSLAAARWFHGALERSEPDGLSGVRRAKTGVVVPFAKVAAVPNKASPRQRLVDDAADFPTMAPCPRYNTRDLHGRSPPIRVLAGGSASRARRTGQDLLRHDRDPAPCGQSRILHQALPARTARVGARGVLHSVRQSRREWRFAPAVPITGDCRGATPGARGTLGMVRTAGKRADYRRAARATCLCWRVPNRGHRRSRWRWGSSCDKCTTRASCTWISRRRTCCIRLPTTNSASSTSIRLNCMTHSTSGSGSSTSPSSIRVSR